MNIIIAGAGEVGGHAAEVLSAAGHNITLIDLSAETLARLDDRLDVRTLHGHAAHFNVLREAGADRCDLMIAATSVDEINLLAASVAKAAGAKKTIVRVHHTANFRLRGTTYAKQIGIDELICPEHVTSMAIARSIRSPGAIAIEDFGGGKLLMERCTVDENASAIGKPLAEVALPAGTRVVTVEGSSGASLATAATTIQPGDAVTLMGHPDAFDAARKKFQKGKSKHIDIAIMGESSTAVWLCRALKDRRFSVRLFVSDRGRAEQLAEKLAHVTVLEADPTDMGTFTDEHLERVDTFVAVTDEDERNILACSQAKSLGVLTAIAVVQRAKYLRLVSHVGIDHAFSPRADAVKTILKLIETGRVRSLARFAGETASVYEVRPDTRANVLGNDLRNIKLPPQSMIAAIRREDDVHVPGADDQVQSGDVLLVIGPVGIEKQLTDVFLNR
jgi:trk/ktr system potassium uptake protein